MILVIMPIFTLTCEFSVMILIFPWKYTASSAIPPPPEPKSRPRTVKANRRHVECLKAIAAGGGQVLEQRVVLFGDSWFERFEERNSGAFVKHVWSCADQGPNSVEKYNILIELRSPTLQK